MLTSETHVNMNTWRAILIGACAVLLGGLLFFLGRWTAPAPEESVETVVVTDTLTIRDTITKVKPVPQTRVVRDSIYVAVRDTVTVRDTCYMALPREVKTYQDERYYAEVSGYQPNLDRIDIFEQTKIITNDKTTTVTRKTRWGIGIQVGAGVTIDKQPEWRPYVGVGLSYNLVNW